MYKVTATPGFEDDFGKLDKSVRTRILEKIDYLAKNPSIIQRVRYTPKDLQGLCKYRVGQWRILFWTDHKDKTIVLYGVDTRGNIYRGL